MHKGVNKSMNIYETRGFMQRYYNGELTEEERKALFEPSDENQKPAEEVLKELDQNASLWAFMKDFRDSVLDCDDLLRMVEKESDENQKEELMFELEMAKQTVKDGASVLVNTLSKRFLSE